MSQEVEGVFGGDESDVHVHYVDHVAFLVPDICVQAPCHIHFSTLSCQLTPNLQAGIVVSLGATKTLGCVRVMRVR